MFRALDIEESFRKAAVFLLNIFPSNFTGVSLANSPQKGFCLGFSLPGEMATPFPLSGDSFTLKLSPGILFCFSSRVKELKKAKELEDIQQHPLAM